MPRPRRAGPDKQPPSSQQTEIGETVFALFLRPHGLRAAQPIINILLQERKPSLQRVPPSFEEKRRSQSLFSLALSAKGLAEG